MKAALRYFLLTLVCLSIGLSAAAQQFGSPTAYPVGPHDAEPLKIVTGDFNRDGKLDLAVADTMQGGVAILLGNGDGTFQSAKHLRASEPAGLAVGDLNGDGIPDLVVVCYRVNEPMIVYLGNGDGSFSSAARYLLRDAPNAVALADFNGDGKLDVVVAHSSNFNTQVHGYVSVFFGNGDGALTQSTRYKAGWGPWGVAVADFNGDGHPDIVVASDNAFHANDPNTLYVLLNNGDGTFSSAGVYQTGTESLNVSVADLNRDGKADLVVASAFGNFVVVLLGKGDGTFDSPVFYVVTGVSQAPYDIAVADFDGDGVPDIAVVSSVSGVCLLYGNGDGTFQPAVATSAGEGGESMVSGDFDEDGAPDLAYSIFYRGEAVVLLNLQ